MYMCSAAPHPPIIKALICKPGEYGFVHALAGLSLFVKFNTSYIGCHFYVTEALCVSGFIRLGRIVYICTYLEFILVEAAVK